MQLSGRLLFVRRPVLATLDDPCLLAQCDIEEHDLPIQCRCREFLAIGTECNGKYVGAQLEGLDCTRAAEDVPHANTLIPGAACELIARRREG